MRRVLPFLLIVLLLLTPARAAGVHSVTAADDSRGTLKLDVSSAPAGETVTGTLIPKEGYDAATVRLEYGGKTDYAQLDGLSFSFPMPDGDVTVTAAWFSTQVWDGAVDVSWYDPDQSEYSISTPAQLAGLAALVNGMTDVHTPPWLIKGDRSLISCRAYDDVMLVGAGGGNVSDTVYCSDLDFAYKTVYLTSDLDMGGVQAPDGSWSGPNWTPIGGKFSMDPEEIQGDSFVLDTRFNGVLDGRGHTVKNLCCRRYAAKGFPYSMAIGLVGYLGGSGDVSGISADFGDTWQPAVRNVAVGPGYIYGRRMVAGVVGRIGSASGGVVVENCANFATVLNTDAKGVGGIVGAGWGKGVIRNCYNAGNINTIYSCPAGGICASNDGLDILNCYNVGAINSNGAVRGRAIGGHDSGTYRVLNCYYLEGCDDDPASGGWYAGTAGSRLTLDITALSESELKSEAFLARLNGNGAAFVPDKEGINGGYPILWFQGKAHSGSCAVRVSQGGGGEISCDAPSAVPAGTLVQLSARAEAGYTLKTFLVNGKPIQGDFWTVTADSVFSAEFTPIRSGRLHMTESPDLELSVLRSGWRYDGEDLLWVEAEPVYDGDLLLQENTLSVSARGYEDISPPDMDLEFTDGFSFTVTGAEKLRSGVYTVTGEGDVALSAERGTQKKTWLSLADTGWYDRSGSYTLKSAEELAGLALLVNSGKADFTGETVTLGADISLKNTDGTVGVRTWKGIGVSADRAFCGLFQGEGHLITDMTAWSEGSYAALFGYVKGAVLRDFTVCGTSSCAANTACAAGIAACAEESRIENCSSRVTVSVTGSVAGGITAHISGGTVLSGCRNYGDVTGLCSLGGLAAVVYSGEDSLEDSCNFGAVTALGSGSSGTGGLAGKLTGTILRCANTGEIVSADRYTGGLAGYTVGRQSSAIRESQSTGNLRVSSAAPNAGAGTLVGYAQYLRMENCAASGSAAAEADFPAQGLGGLVGKAGPEAQISGCGTDVGSADFGFEELELPQPEAQDQYTVTFLAEGKPVETVFYRPGDTAVREPAVPKKEGHTGFWNRYRLGAADLRVEAVYRPAKARGGDTLENGTWVLAYGAAGTLDIRPGARITLTGEAEGLSIQVGAGAELTLDNVSLSGSGTLMTLEPGCRLILRGRNTLEGRSDRRGNEDPTLSFSDTLEMGGSGSLTLTAGTGNAALWAEKGDLILSQGLFIVKKRDLLGQEGGALSLGGGSLTLRGGSLLAYTDSDNVPAVYAGSIAVDGGSLNARCVHTEQVLSGDVQVSGGKLRLWGHSPNSAAGSRDTFNESALSSFDGEGFYGISPVGKVVRTNQTIRFCGETVSLEVYNIDGSNYFRMRDVAALLSASERRFALDFDPELYAVYAETGKSYEFVGGERQLGADLSASAVSSRWLLYVDGVLHPCDTVNIGGNNYFKLRDLSGALGFSAEYEPESRTVEITP